MKTKEKSGISLIVLIITILVMIILAGVVVVSLQKNNPIQKAKQATYLHDAAAFKEQLSVYTVKAFSKDPLFTKGQINAKGYEEIKKYVPDFQKKYEKMYEIKNGEIYYNPLEAKKNNLQYVLYENKINPQFINFVANRSKKYDDMIIGLGERSDGLYILSGTNFTNVKFVPGYGRKEYVVSINQEPDQEQLVFENCIFTGKMTLMNHNGFINAIFKNCKFENIQMEPGIYEKFNDRVDIKFINCEINTNDRNFIITRPFSYSRGKINVTFDKCRINSIGNKPFINLEAKPTSGQIKFVNTSISVQGPLVEGWNIDKENFRFDIILENSSKLPELPNNLKSKINMIVK